MAENTFQRNAFDAQLVARALKDGDFRERLIQDPRGIYEEAIQPAMPGLAIPDEVEIRVVEETESVFYLVLPCVPPGSELSDDAIDRIARHQQTHRNPCWGLGDAPEEIGQPNTAKNEHPSQHCRANPG
ncbi:MAG: NHLP leader peptide family RiPP precursor [Pirellulales bacterium]|nr:NHLP leader peptide family RiPP precursor [Pirellulales bacterium]